MRVLLIDDHALVRKGMIALLSAEIDDIEFGECENASDGFNTLLAEDWNLVIVDITMPGRSGLDLIRDIRTAKPRTPVLVVSAHSERDYAIRALKLGAAGYLSKQSASDALVTAVNRVLAGGRYVSPALAELLAGSISGAASEANHEALSDRELEVLRLIARGYSNKSAGAELCLSEKTIATYRARIGAKLGLSTNVELARYALQHGLVD